MLQFNCPEGFSHFHQVHTEMLKESSAVSFIMFVCLQNLVLEGPALCLSVHFVYPCVCLSVVLQSAVTEGLISYITVIKTSQYSI